LLDDGGTWKGLAVNAELVMLQKLDRQDCGGGNGEEGKLIL
jgi:hypothetical protein